MEVGVEEEELNSRATRTEDCAPEVEVVAVKGGWPSRIVTILSKDSHNNISDNSPLGTARMKEGANPPGAHSKGAE